MELFREKPLIEWPFTDAILFTAYDVYRSNDFWIDSIVTSGKTLKEALNELGFPKAKTLVADTGVFEVEARKAGIARELGIQVDIELSNSQIFEAYELSGADYFVAPDEIVLPNEKNESIRRKIRIIERNLTELLEIIHPSKVIAVIQGHTEAVIDGLFEFYRSNGVSHFAMGGVIPLYHFDKTLLGKVLKYVRRITDGLWLHVFGLPHLGLLQYYLHEIGVNSVDTSALLYITARRRYLIGSNAEPVRNALFEKCGCKGCQALRPEMSTTSSEFFLNLYIHNLLAAAKLTLSMEKGDSENIAKETTKWISTDSGSRIEETREAQLQRLDSDWRSAHATYEEKKVRADIQSSHLDLSLLEPRNNPEHHKENRD
jgi:hypothetical protein